MTYEDKASYDSTPPCTLNRQGLFVFVFVFVFVFSSVKRWFFDDVSSCVIDSCCAVCVSAAVLYVFDVLCRMCLMCCAVCV